MQSLAQIHNYWLQAFKQTKVFDLGSYSVNDKTVFIRKEDVVSGRINGPLVADLSTALIIPILATNNTAIFIPLILEVTIDNDGYFIPAKHNSLPIIPRAVREGALLNPVVLGDSQVFDNFYSLNPPKWLEENYLPSWSEQLEYATSMLQQTAQGLWQQQLGELGYSIDENWSLVIPANAIPSVELQTASTLIEKLYEFEPVDISDDANKDADADIRVIHAQRGSGKSQYIASLILADWMSSAIDGTLPKCFAWLPVENCELARYANIFDCYCDDQVWLTAKTRKEILAPQIFSDFSISYCLQDFLSLLSNYLQIDILHLDHAQEELLAILRKKNIVYQDSMALLKSWDDFNKFLAVKYKDNGGIHVRIRELKHNLSIVQQELRYLTGIFAIWERLFTSASLLPTWFDAIKFINHFKNRKLYKFYAQYFPDDQVKMLSAAAMNAKLFGKMQILKDKEQLLNERIQQSVKELLKLDAIRLQCKNWFIDRYQHPITDYQEAQNFMNIAALNNLNFITLKYYEAILIANFAWSKSHNPYAQYFLDGGTDYIDILCVEHANYIPTIDILPLISRTKKALIFGNNERVLAPSMPASIDLELCKFAKIVENALDFEDLQFSGMLASVGNLWQFATKSLIVTSKMDKSYYSQPEIMLYNIQHTSEHYLGSRSNDLELELINKQLFEIYEQGVDNLDGLTIYTTFSAQLHKIASMLAGTVFQNVPVKLLKQPSIQRCKHAILSLVCSQNELPNLRSFIDKLLCNTSQQLIVIGDLPQFLTKYPLAANKHVSPNELVN